VVKDSRPTSQAFLHINPNDIGRTAGILSLLFILAPGIFIPTVLAMETEQNQNAGILGRKQSIMSPRQQSRKMGPLKAHPENPSYFSYGDGNPVFLTGSHSWCNFQDCGTGKAPVATNYLGYLDMLERRKHNFIRLWYFESFVGVDNSNSPVFRFSPLPYATVSSEDDTRLWKLFDLEQFNNDYFKRLRSRVVEARDRGIYVSIMLFNGWSTEIKNGVINPWPGHPFNRRNNINGVDGDPNNRREGGEVHQLRNPDILKLQERYVRKVIDSVNDLDNVLYEISNESSTLSHDWQYHMIDYINAYQADKANQHPVGMTVAFPNGDNQVLRQSPADWISPSEFLSPLPDDKVVIYDSDHLCGICWKREWIWQSLTSGANWIFMDPLGSHLEIQQPIDAAAIENVRDNMGYALSYADRINLARSKPAPQHCSSKFCLYDPSPAAATVLAYLNRTNEIKIDLSDISGKLQVEWFDPSSGKTLAGEKIQAGKPDIRFESPFNGRDSVLFLYQQREDTSVAPAK
jgi:hypothetical protein